MRDNHLIIFMKYPSEGEVKTRLGRVLGHKKSLDIYKYLLKTVFEKFINSCSYRRWVFFTPPDRYRDLRMKIADHSVTLIPQNGKDLGEIISDALTQVFDQIEGNVVIMGTDCPEMTPDDVDRAFKCLDNGEADLVIGPATDGGYYMLGMNQYLPDLFEDIEWGTANVLKQTVKNIVQLGISYRITDELRDLDTVEDLDLNLINSVKEHIKDFKVV